MSNEMQKHAMHDLGFYPFYINGFNWVILFLLFFLIIIIWILPNIFSSKFMLYLPSFDKKKQHYVRERFVFKVYF